jgi:hypothetical protein
MIVEFPFRIAEEQRNYQPSASFFNKDSVSIKQPLTF